jgi:hypothetical protein
MRVIRLRINQRVLSRLCHRGCGMASNEGGERVCTGFEHVCECNGLLIGYNSHVSARLVGARGQRKAPRRLGTVRGYGPLRYRFRAMGVNAYEST